MEIARWCHGRDRQTGPRRQISGRLPRPQGDAFVDVQHGTLRNAGRSWTWIGRRRSGQHVIIGGTRSGQSSDGQFLIVSHTDRGELTRVISARKMTRKERRAHEEGQA